MHSQIRFAVLGVLLVALSCTLYAGGNGTMAIIPAFHDRTNQLLTEGNLKLKDQRFIIFVYEDAVAVYSEGHFQNTGRGPVVQEFALPSSGHNLELGETDQRSSNGILSVQVWFDRERIPVEFSNDGLQDWYTARVRFLPGEERIFKALFWCQTSFDGVDSLPGIDTTQTVNGVRGFMVDLSHAAVWAGTIESIDIVTVFKHGAHSSIESFKAVPETYDKPDSTIVWDLLNVDPIPQNDIYASYATYGQRDANVDTMAKLAEYIVTKGYDELMNYARTSFQDEDN